MHHSLLTNLKQLASVCHVAYSLVRKRKQKHKHKQLILVKTNVDISIKINHSNHHFDQMFRPRESKNECFNWPDATNVLVLMCVSFSHDASDLKHIKAQAQGDLCACALCACAYARVNPVLTVK